MDTLDYWTPADALARRCAVAQVGTLKPQEPDVAPLGNSDLREDQALARAYAPRAVRALVRIMEGDNERAALDAARELLTRAYGDAVQPPPPQPPSPPALPDPQEPEWIDPSRLSYGQPSQ